MTMDRIDKLFHCTDCKKSYKRKSDLNRLYRSKREKIVCPICDHHFNRKVNFKTHYRRFHKAASSIQVGGNNQPPLSTKTKEQQSSFQSEKRAEDEAETGEELQEKEPEDNEHEVTQAINDQVTSIRIKPRDVEKFDVLVFYSNIKDKIKEFIISHSPVRKGLKWYLVTRVEFTREKEGKVEKALPHFRSITYRHLTSEEFNIHFLNESFQKMFTAKEEFIMKGSDWIFSKVIYVELCYVVYSPLKGGTYIREPTELRNSKSLVNVRNRDQKCFLYSVLAKLYPAKRNPSRVSHYYAYLNKVNMQGIHYPVHITQISKFENQNNISVNVFGYEDKEIFPIRITKLKKKSHVNLLYLKDK